MNAWSCHHLHWCLELLDVSSVVFWWGQKPKKSKEVGLNLKLRPSNFRVAPPQRSHGPRNQSTFHDTYSNFYLLSISPKFSLESIEVDAIGLLDRSAIVGYTIGLFHDIMIDFAFPSL